MNMNVNTSAPRFGALYQLSREKYETYQNLLYDTSDKRDAGLASFLDGVSGETGVKSNYLLMQDSGGRPFLLTAGGVDDVAEFRNYNQKVCNDTPPARALADYVQKNESRIQYRA